MSSSREASPDWLRSFQAPNQSILTLSSGSESPLDDCPASEDEKDKDQTSTKSPISKTSKVKTLDKKPNPKTTPTKKRKGENLSKSKGKEDGKVAKGKTSKKPMEPQEPNLSVFSLSSDSESGPATSPLRDDNHEELFAKETEQHPKKEKDKDAVLLVDTAGEPSRNKAFKLKSPKKKLEVEDQRHMKTIVNSHMKKENDGDIEVEEEETTEKPIGPYVSSSKLPLVLSEKVQRSKALVECEGESIDLSGDVGSVGRVVISDNTSGDHDVFLDLKGTIYKTTIVPSRTFCVVSFGPSEAKIEAIMNDFIQLEPQSNVYEAETMIEGTLEGISFDSDDEADNIPKAANQTDKNEGAEPQANGKGRKKAEKSSGATRKQGKAAAKKPPKKVKKKAQAPKKTKTKK